MRAENKRITATVYDVKMCGMGIVIFMFIFTILIITTIQDTKTTIIQVCTDNK